MEWLKEDLAGAFASRFVLHPFDEPEKFSTIVLARKKLDDVGSTMNDLQRAAFLKGKGINTGIIRSSDTKTLAEMQLSLFKISAGLQDLDDMVIA